MADPRHYGVFISYSHSDAGWANWLMRRLEAFRTPATLVRQGCRRTLGPVFRDRDELASGADLSEQLQAALQASDALVVICSPDAAGSAYVADEVRRYLELGRGHRVFCVLVAGEPGSPDPAEQPFPLPLLAPDADGVVHEPLAADLRPGGDGRQLALLKIAAGLLELPLDNLVQRAAQQRHRRMLAITAASVAGMALTLVLAITAWRAEQEANQRREQAEALLQFMVGDLRASLEPLGRLDLLVQVADQAMEHFAAVPTDRLSGQELQQQVLVLTQIGEVRLDQFDRGAATRAFAAALDRATRLARDQPDSADLLFQRAQAEYWMGVPAVHAGDIATARHWWRTYMNSAQALHALEGNTRRARRELGYGHHNLGVLADREQQAEAAAQHFQAEHQLLVALLADSPDGIQLHRDLGDVASWLCSNHHDAGALDQAMAHCTDALNRARHLHQLVPDDRRQHYNLATRLRQWAALRTAANGAPEAATRAAMEEAEALLANLVAVDPDNRRWHYQWLLARAGHLAQSPAADPATRQAALDSLLADLATLKSRALDTLNLQVLQVRTLLLAAGNGVVPATTVAADLTTTLPSISAALGTLNSRHLAVLANGWLWLGDHHQRMGVPEQASAAWAHALAVLKHRPGAGSPEWQQSHCLVQQRLGAEPGTCPGLAAQFSL